jgi:hypothetical protein
MIKRYVIKWKSKVNGRAGKGTKLFDRAEASRLAEELNREYPQIEHEAVDANQGGRAEGVVSVSIADALVPAQS